MRGGLKSKPVVAVAAPTEPIETQLETAVAQLHAVEIELADVGRAIQKYRSEHRDLRTHFVGMTVRLDQWKMHPRLRELENQRDHIIRRRNEVLHRYAVAKVKLQTSKEAPWI